MANGNVTSTGALAPAASASVGQSRGIWLAVAAVRSAAAVSIIALYILVVGPPALLLSIPLKTDRLVFAVGHLGVYLGMLLTGIRLRLEGAERLKRSRPAVYCANHQSNIEPPLLMTWLHPRIRVLFKAEMTRLPVLGRALLQARLVPVDRRDPEKARAAVDQAARQLRQGDSFLVFPEGTRSRTRELLPFKKGGFVMALEAQVPIVPVAVSGGLEAMPRGSAIIRPVTLRARVGEPIETTGLTLADRDRLIDQVRGRIESMLVEMS